MSLEGCPIPGARGFQRVDGRGSCGVLILGEAMGQQEVDEGCIGFVEWAQAGSVLSRAIRRVGMARDQFFFWNVVPTQPPKNWLEGAPWEREAIAWGRPFLDHVIESHRPRAILALGNVATRVTTGLSGDKLGVSHLSGFVLPSQWAGVPVVPCFHPSFLRQGHMSHFSVLLRALRLATAVSREGRQPQLPPVDNPPPGYILYPTEEAALEFEREAREARYIAYDIETPYSTAEDTAEEDNGKAENERGIISIQFSLHDNSGIYLQWRDPFISVARRILAGSVAKLGWNIWRFDNPVLKANACKIGGESHDLMWGWHHLNPDLPRGLQFAAAQSGWPWPWKHLDNAAPQFYGIVDVDALHFLAGV
jgi:uracil-DNA glycosylase family 4